MEGMKPGQIAAAVVSVGGMGAVVAAFLLNASPYVTVAEAKTTQRHSVHLAGDILRETMDVLPSQGFVRFVVKDEKGDTIPVIYRGAPPGNMGTATKVVAVGAVEKGIFEADKIILKCPSKYEAEEGKQQS
jgi:cytochrome c-type biogenesis protein CcmE